MDNHTPEGGQEEMTRYLCLWCGKGVVEFHGSGPKSPKLDESGKVRPHPHVRVERMCSECHRPNHIDFLRKYGKKAKI